MSGVVWTSTEASVVTGGTSTQAWCATGVSMNMEEIKPGDLYVATKEDDLAQVFAKGAVAAMISMCADVEGDYPLLKVGSVFEALQDLARAARHKTHAHIISVQGKKARSKIYDILCRAGAVHQGGRHLSLGLASLPEDVDYGLYGASPAVQPDIAVITEPSMANRDTLFEMMPVSGAVIIRADDDSFLPMIARAQAAGVQHIYTYGRYDAADARIEMCVEASNGTRVSGYIFGEAFSFTVPAQQDVDSNILAALLALKLTDRFSTDLFDHQKEIKSADNGVMLVNPAKSIEPEAVFRVKNMIDLGFGRQTAMLDNLAETAHEALTLPKKDLSMPRQFAGLNFVYTSKKLNAVKDAHAVIQERHKGVQFEPITPEALAPGDFLVFKSIREKSTAIFSEALRLIPRLKAT